MAVTEAFSGTESVGTTEHSLTTDTAGPDVETSDHACEIALDLSALVETEEYVLKLYEKCRAADTQRLVQAWTIEGRQVEDYWLSPYFCLLHGWDFTLTKVAGTDRTITWSIRSYGTPTEYATGTETVGTTEWSLTTDTAGPDLATDDKAVQVWIETQALTDADLFQIKMYEKVRSADSQQLAWVRNILGGQTELMYVIPVRSGLHGWDVTLKKISGTDRAINWSLRSVA